MNNFETAKQFRNFGMSSDLAEAVIAHIEAVVDSRAVTRSDLTQLRLEMARENEGLHAATSQQIADSRAKTTRQITNLRDEIAEMRVQNGKIQTGMKWIGGALAVFIPILQAALTRWMNSGF